MGGPLHTTGPGQAEADQNDVPAGPHGGGRCAHIGVLVARGDQDVEDGAILPGVNGPTQQQRPHIASAGPHVGVEADTGGSDSCSNAAADRSTAMTRCPGLTR